MQNHRKEQKVEGASNIEGEYCYSLLSQLSVGLSTVELHFTSTRTILTNILTQMEPVTWNIMQDQNLGTPPQNPLENVGAAKGIFVV